jgi:ketosteroid isomerase-like protein
MDRQELLDKIDKAYELRARGDATALAALFHEKATFAFAGHPKSLPGMPVGPTPVMSAVKTLIDAFTFHVVERTDALVEGDRAAVLSRVKLTGPKGNTAETQFYDLWTFEQGKVLSIFQYADTALLAAL